MNLTNFSKNESAIIFLKWILCISVFIAVYFYYRAMFKNYSMLVETTCWINDHLAVHDLNYTLSFMWGRVMNFFEIQNISRYFSFVNISFYGYACGTDLACHNSFQVMWIAFSGFLLTTFLIQLKESFLFSALIGLFWSFSYPVFDALTWQATIHDKLVTTFILLSLSLTYFFASRRFSLVNLILSNCLVFVSVLLAYNSKEMSFGLAPAMFLCVLFFSKENWKKWLLFVLPFAYAIFNVGVRAYFILTQKKDEHVFAAKPFDHVYQYISYYFNKNDEHYGHLIANSLLYVFILYWAINYKSFFVKKLTYDQKKIGYLFLVWLLIVFPALQTQFSDGFYMLAPSAFFIALSLVLCRQLLLDLLSLIKEKVPTDFQKTAHSFGLVLIFIFFLGSAWLQFVNHTLIVEESRKLGYLNFSENIQKAFTVIRSKLSAHADEKIYVGFDDNKMTYKFLCHGCNYTFMFEKYDLGLKKDKLFECSTADKISQKVKSDSDKSYYLIFTDQLSLAEIYHGQEKLF